MECADERIKMAKRHNEQNEMVEDHVNSPRVRARVQRRLSPNISWNPNIIGTSTTCTLSLISINN